MNEFELFQLALDFEDPAARSLFLKSTCEQDGEMLIRVEALLASHDGQSQFLNSPVVEQIADGTNVDPDVTALLPNGSAHTMTHQDNADDEIPLGYLELSTMPGSLGRLAHYEVLEVIGRGAFGTVLRAFDEKLQRVVAIKIMALELAATSPARKRFMREAQASAAIRHENVVSVYAVEEKPLPYLVMEYIPGRTLLQQLNEKGPLDVPTVLRLGRQIAEGLAAAHAQDLIHRDIKPGNILLETSVHDRVKITDFGLARAADDASLTQSGTIAGTPLYMAPEQVLGHNLDQRADLFSFGSVLYQMVSGRPPFRAPTALAVLKRVVDETPRPIREIIPETPQWLCDIITKLHAKNPDERYQTAREIADVLANCESQLKTQTSLKDFSLIPKIKTQSVGRWKWVAVAALALPFLVFGLIALNRPEAQFSVEGNESNKLPMPDTDKPSRELIASEATELGTKEPDDWVQLFNGKDLTGWKFHPDHPGHWEVKYGILKGSKMPSFLLSQRDDYADFHLRVEVKINLGGDSGIMFRAPLEIAREGAANDFGSHTCYEAELQKKQTYTRRTGTISISLSDAPPIDLEKVLDNSLTQADEWFTYEVIAVNNHFITKINGVETANCYDRQNRRRTGHLALQVWHPNTLVQFRKIEIKELPSPSSLTEAQEIRRFASDEWFDVIQFIDPQADKWDVPQRTGKNAWRIEQGELVIGGDKLGSKLVLPLDSDWPAFEFQIEFTRRSGDSGFNVDLPAKPGTCPLVFDYPGNGGGVFLGSRTKGVVLKTGAQMVTGQRATMCVEIGRQQQAEHVSVAFNDENVGEWTGDCNAIANTYKENYPHDRRVSLTIHPGGNEFVFHRIRVRMLDGGSVETLPPVQSTPPVPVAKQETPPDTKPTVSIIAQTKAGVPKFWTDEEMKNLELPLANAAASPRHISAEYYSQVPEMQLCRSYPVYQPDKEPAGYFEKLLTTAPEVIWDGQQHPPQECYTEAVHTPRLCFGLSTVHFEKSSHDF